MIYFMTFHYIHVQGTVQDLMSPNDADRSNNSDQSTVLVLTEAVLSGYMKKLALLVFSKYFSRILVYFKPRGLINLYGKL